MYPKTYGENIRFRDKIISSAEADIETQQLVMIQCKRSILFFFNTFLRTYDPRLAQSNIPFITYPYQDKYLEALVQCIINDRDNITEKSRDMWFSWMILWVLLRGFLFHWWSSLIGSYKENYVDEQGNMDSSFERLRYMISYLPKWMLPTTLDMKYMSISDTKTNKEISGDAWRNFGTGWRRKVVFMDEFALRPADSTAFRKTRDITNCRIIGWTPEGTMNIYGKIMTNHPDYIHLDIKKYRLHWKLHPLKTQERYEREKKKRTVLDVAKELDISYDDSVSGAVYKSFRNMVAISYYPYDPNMKLYRSFDFGRDSNACIRWQKDFRTNMLYIIRSVRRKDWNIKQFAWLVTGRPTPWFLYTEEDIQFMDEIADRRKTSGDYGDPYNADSTTTNTQWPNSIRQQFQEFWIYLRTKRSTLEERIRKTTLALERVKIDQTVTDVIESMVQSKYPQVPENSQWTREKLKPVHDDNSHMRTAFEYFIDNEPESFIEAQWIEVDYSAKLY